MLRKNLSSFLLKNNLHCDYVTNARNMPNIFSFSISGKDGDIAIFPEYILIFFPFAKAYPRWEFTSRCKFPSQQIL
jgi:hypothetical protein